MDKQFESFLNDLAGELKKAAECPVWEIPMNHRTKDSISSFRASVGMLSSILVRLVEKHRAPVDQTSGSADEVGLEQSKAAQLAASPTSVPENLDGPVGQTEPSTDVAAQPLATDPERLFDADADRPRRRRNHGG
jgi:hypothetical protein